MQQRGVSEQSLIGYWNGLIRTDREDLLHGSPGSAAESFGWSTAQVVSSFFFLLEARWSDGERDMGRVVRFVTCRFGDVERIRARHSLSELHLFLVANTDVALGEPPILKKIRSIHSSHADGPLFITFEDRDTPLLTVGEVPTSLVSVKRLYPSMGGTDDAVP